MFGYGDYTYPERVYGCIRFPPRRAPVGSPPNAPATIQFWQSIPVSMPDFSRPEVSQAFDPQHFLDCQDAGFAGGCPAMDFPTASPDALLIHTDPTPVPAASAQAAAIGSPIIVVSGPAEIKLAEGTDGSATSVAITVRNDGTWIGPFRIRTSAPWIVVRHARDPAGRSLDAGVAIGADTDVVTQQASAGPPAKPRLSQKGYASDLIVTADPSLIRPGEAPEGTLWIEPLLGGPAYEFRVSITGHTVIGLPFRSVIPRLSSEPVN
jgi:hypothetical protein